MSSPILELRNVSKAYFRSPFDRAAAFRLEVDRSFARPEIVGVMGPNGAGKTTLFEMIAGSNIPTSGRIAIAGQDIQRVRYRQRDRLAIHYHQSYQVRRFQKWWPSFMLEPAGSAYPTVDLFEEPQFATQDICLHPTARSSSTSSVKSASGSSSSIGDSCPSSARCPLRARAMMYAPILGASPIRAAVVFSRRALVAISASGPSRRQVDGRYRITADVGR